MKATMQLYSDIYLNVQRTKHIGFSLIIGYTLHRFIPIPLVGIYEFPLFTTHRSFVFVCTASVDCHSLSHELNSLPKIISTARDQRIGEYKKATTTRKGKGGDTWRRKKNEEGRDEHGAWKKKRRKGTTQRKKASLNKHPNREQNLLNKWRCNLKSTTKQNHKRYVIGITSVLSQKRRLFEIMA